MKCIKCILIGLSICLAVFFILKILYYIMFIVMMSSIGEETVTQTVPSPTGAYEAYVISRDEGALGGRTSVWVKKTKFISPHKEKRLQSGRYDEEYDLVWTDNNTLTVNGTQKYEMKNIWRDGG